MLKSDTRILCSFLSLALICGSSAGLVACGDEGLKAVQNAQFELLPDKFLFPKVNIGSSVERVVTIRNIGESELILTNIVGNFSNEYSLYWYRADRNTTPCDGPEVCDNLDGRNAPYACEEQRCIPRQRFGIVGVDGLDDDNEPDPPRCGGNGDECNTDDDCAAAGQMCVPAARANAFPNIVNVLPNELVNLILVYQPVRDGEPTGSVNIESNAGNIVIPIDGADSNAELFLESTVINFDRVSVGQTEEITITASSVGQSTLNIEDMQMFGPFAFRVNGESVDENPAVLIDPDGDGRPGVAPGGNFTLTFLFTAINEISSSGELSIISNSVARDTRITLIANGTGPCLRVIPTELEFGAAVMNVNNPRQLTLESCGGDPVRLDAIELVDNGGGVFSFLEETVPGPLPALLPGADLQRGTFPSRAMTVMFNPPEERAYQGMIRVTSNDPAIPTVDVPIRGRGTSNECPVARVTEEELYVEPLDVINLDGSPSTDDNETGRPAEYAWVVVERPAGSTSVPIERLGDVFRPADGGPADNTATPQAVFFVDIAGTYVIELQVTDEGGLTAPSDICPQPAARVTIDAEPDEDIHLQLVWDTPQDPDQTDFSGTDVDMHFLHPNGPDWFDRSLDCYFANPTPDWARNGPSDDPSLDIDDTNGAGPENINLDNPEDTGAIGGQYKVGIHYYRAEADAFGGTPWASDVTVRIYLGGVLASEVQRNMATTNRFWEVAAITWTAADRRVIPINREFERSPF